MNEDLTGDLFDALGADGFLALIEYHGGTRLYVPQTPSGSKLASEIGTDATARLSNLYPSGYIKVPLAREFRAAHYREAGATNREIARKLGLTEAGVERLFKRVNKAPKKRPGRPKDTRQIDLFR